MGWLRRCTWEFSHPYPVAIVLVPAVPEVSEARLASPFIVLKRADPFQQIEQVWGLDGGGVRRVPFCERERRAYAAS